MNQPIAIPRPVLDRIHTLRLRRFRDKTRLHFVEGLRGVLEALEAHVPVETLVYSEILCRHASAQKRVRLAKRLGVRVERVTPEQFRKISQTPRASGLGAVVRQHWTGLAQIEPRRGPASHLDPALRRPSLCWLALSQIRSPGNLGTILRTAEAVGAAGLIVLGNECDPFDPDVVRASMGGIFHLTMCRATLGEFAAWAQEKGCRVIATSPMGETEYTEMPVEPPVVILLGEERNGLTAEEFALATHRVRIPIVGRADSLNVGVAAGVMMYEVLRRQQAR